VFFFLSFLLPMGERGRGGRDMSCGVLIGEGGEVAIVSI